MRNQQRANDQLRTINITRHYTQHAEGSVLIEFGETKVLCNASVVKGRPRWMREQEDERGWVTAEYGMLPRSTHERMRREASAGKQGGRTLEIQRLIARSLRAAIDLNQLGDYTITVDCDVIQADGGTRTAAITGACIALYDALDWMCTNKKLTTNPFKQFIAAISVGIYNEQFMLDLDYAEDSNAETDMNIVMAENGTFIEVQGTAEGQTFSAEELQKLLTLATSGVTQLIKLQKQSVINIS